LQIKAGSASRRFLKPLTERLNRIAPFPAIEKKTPQRLDQIFRQQPVHKLGLEISLHLQVFVRRVGLFPVSVDLFFPDLIDFPVILGATKALICSGESREVFTMALLAS